MDTLQKLLNEVLENYISWPNFATDFIIREFKKKGVSLTKSQEMDLKLKFQNFDLDSPSFEFELLDEQKEKLGIFPGDKTFTMDFGSDTDIDKYFDKMNSKIAKIVSDFIEQSTERIYSRLIRDLPNMLRKNRKTNKKFIARVNKDWEKPFDLLEAFLVLNYEAGAEFNDQFRQEKSLSNYFLLEALTRLHARACQIGLEVFVLLQNGFADGAHARWRSLHEIAVVSSFLRSHGNEVAEKYLLHENIESYKIALLQNKHYEALGIEPVSEEKLNELKANRDDLISRFGKPYKNLFGWASETLNINNPNFAELEKHTSFDYMHPYYKLASHNVHANPKGIMFKLGLINNTQNILLAGPSNFGFTDPGHGSAISLGYTTITLLTTKPNIDNAVLSNIITKLQDEIGNEFLEVQNKIFNRVSD